jgi:hypothetical protein
MIKICEKYSHNFESSILPFIIPIVGDFDITSSVTLIDWYTPSMLRKECVGDWNKGGGVGAYFTLNNQSAVMLGWRCGQKPFTWDVCLYTNRQDKSFYTTDYITIECYNVVTLRFTKYKNTLTASLNATSSTNKSYKPLETKFFLNSKLTRLRGVWHGGQCGSPVDAFKLYQKWHGI